MKCKDCTYYITDNSDLFPGWKHDPNQEIAICALKELFSEVRADTPVCSDFVEAEE